MLLNIMKIFKNLFGKNDKISADEIALSDGRLVSDSIIVESGSNTKGKFVKFADGTLICYQRMNLGKSVYGAGTFNNPYRTETKDWEFPISFVDNNVILNMSQLSVSSDSSQRLGNCSNSDMTNIKVNQVQFACNSATAFTHDVLVNLIAIGRWK